MRVGITAHFQFSVFSGGGSSTVFAVAEMMKILGHDVTLLNLNGRQEWWDDLKSLKTIYPVQNVCDVTEPYDLVLEVTSNLADKETRERCGKQCVWVIRKPALLQDIENSIFPVNMGKRNLEGLTAVWVFDEESTKDDMQYLETLSRVPVFQVPYLWSPTLAMTHKKESNLPQWIEVAVAVTQQNQKIMPWSVHICETNNSATSSCTIPLVALRELKKQNKFEFSKYRIHNAQPVENSAFFKQNVFAHSQIDGLSGEFCGRQRIADWLVDPMSCILAHTRFRRVRPYVLEALWLGIPIVHNCPSLMHLTDEYDKYTYNDNNITEAVTAMNQLQKDLVEGKGMFQKNAVEQFQQKLLEKFSPIAVKNVNAWKTALSNLPAVTVSKPVTTVSPVATVVTPVIENTASSHFTVLFLDMWDDFNPTYNMFTLLLQEASKNLTVKPIVSGYSKETLPAAVKPNCILFGPFGSEWKDQRWKSIPKAHFTGENTAPIQDPDVFLNMGYPHIDFIDEKYIRLPLWMLEIDWFGADLEKIQNPKPLPLDRCLKTYPEEIAKKDRFCAFVVTNPCNPVRNDAFHWLSQYKRVDSAGRLFNNIGDEIFAGLGGGGGELKKHEFLKKYKFCLAYENSSSQGYTTEKLLHAKVAGCIPIYWGDPKVDRDFDVKGFIDARKFTTPDQLIEAVKKIDEDENLYKKMLSVPALDDYKRDFVRRTFSHIAYRILKTCYMNTLQVDQIPKFLGAKSSSEAEELARARGEKTSVISTSGKKSIRNDPIVMTMATLRFLPSLFSLLSGVAQQKKVLEKLDCIVWLSKDIPSDTEVKLKENFPFVSFEHLPEDQSVEGFPDYWNPQHFAWKLYILNWIQGKSDYNERTLLYMDAGVFLSRWPVNWLKKVEEEGICFLEDPRQKNREWCHSTFCSKLNVTEEEKNSQQLWAGCLAFKIGNVKANDLFMKAYELSKDKEIIVGPKWEGMRDGKPFGHRHDQSILSILSQRTGISRINMDDVYCDHSLRKTFQLGKALYVHRGNFTVSKPFAKEISDAFVINLDRRADRMEKLLKNNPELEGRLQRFSAFEGRKIQLTKALARLFRPHDFLWKKAIMGCALSHLELWWQLVNEKPDIENYLILEDDVKLQKGWEERWNAAVPYIPEDYDVIYLGGILPPNRAGFEQMKEKVNPHFSKVALNQMFGQSQPTRYFHWCNYSYILSRKGAVKIIESIFEQNGYYTSADHMVCNRIDKLNHYFLDPLVSGCYQDEDPVYQTSAFNNFNRVDKFDSDLWNNDERFIESEYMPLLAQSENDKIDIAQALRDGRNGKNVTLVAPKLSEAPLPPHKVFVTLPEHNFDVEKAYEKEWIQELVGSSVPFRILTLEDGMEIPENPIIIVQKPYLEMYQSLFEQWEQAKITYSVLHLSDEHLNDPIDFYKFSCCKGVVRTYPRGDIPESVQSKVLTIPLGYHWTMQNGSEDALHKTPRLPFRNTVWSFYGTGWQNRKQLLEPLESIQPNSLLYVDTWESPEKLTRNQYVARLLDSVFIPCPRGNNIETFRLYEALECGCIPIYVKCEKDELYVQMLQDELGLLPVSSWQEAKLLMEHLYREKTLLETYRNTVLSNWKQWKIKLQERIKKIWDL